MEKHEHSVWDKLNELRLLVLMENEEGGFNQVILTPEQFKKVSDAVTTDDVVPDEEKEDLRAGFEVQPVRLGEQEITAEAFLGMESFYEDISNPTDH